MSNEYEDLQILECNNLSSSQYRGGNQDSSSVFTNKLGSVVELKRGDKVSVDKAFINEKGCGLPQGIEVKGVNLDFNKTFTFSKKVNSGHKDVYDKLEKSIYETITPTTTTKTLRDDTMNIEMNYYKNVNGEGYYYLPRRWVHEPQVRAKLPPADAAHPITKNINQAQLIWDTIDSVANGMVFYPVATAGGDKNSLCFDDYNWIFNGTTDAGYFVAAAPPDPQKNGFYKPKHDGKKMTILARNISIFDEGDFSFPDGSTSSGEYEFLELMKTNLPEHSFKYSLYQDILELNIDKGYNSPEDIALKLTEQLQEADEPEYYYCEDASPASHLHAITSTTDTKTFKALNCAWLGGNLETNYTDYQNETGTIQSRINYHSSYNYIGVKRPDMFLAGREVNGYDEQIFIKNTIARTSPTTGNTTDPIITSWEWVSNTAIEPLLKKLSALFIAQERYSELFEGNNTLFGNTEKPITTKKNSRFLHINRYNNTIGDIENRLGFDNHYDRGANRCSMPFFFKYDKDYEGIMSNGLDLTRLAYGFGSKTKLADGKYYLTLHPELVGGLRPYIFDYQTANTITTDQTLIGWDWNFNAYSTLAILLYSGYEKYTHDGLSQPGIVNFEYVHNDVPVAGKNVANILSKTYIGGNNCAVVYNDNHFSFTYLHTAENVGQDFDAGNSNNKDGSVLINPIITDAGEECYKINKRLELWTFTPDMRPYEHSKVINNVAVNLLLADLKLEDNAGNPVDEEHAQITKSINPQTIKPLNKSIFPYSIMDSHSGVVLLMGNTFDENNWREGLSGVLGFSYEQFNPSVIDDTNNRIARIEYSNINKLPFLTTNSEIVSTDAKNYVMNRWGGIMYSTQIPTPLLITGWGQNGVPDDNKIINRDFNAGYLYPTIIEQTQSIPVSTADLARTMIRPYYSIRSDLILQENNKYHGGMDSGARLPVIAIINKENGDGDFYFDGGEFQFTITQDINISSITTSIHDPDGTLANLNNGSGIIYKVSRMKNLDNSIIQEIISSQKKSK